MRVGSNPNKEGTSSYLPARVTICVLVCIPTLTDYHAHRLDVLKLCLDSIVKHTDVPYDLLVLDNGSCDEVVDFLRSLRDQGVIRFLLLSSGNVGMAGAYRLMFGAAPGEVVAYCDDDILFYPGWLQAHLAILDSFPRVGMVSGVPIRHQFRYGNRYLAQYLLDFPNVAAKTGHFIPDEWERDFFASVTGPPRVESTLNRIRAAHTEVVLEHQGLRAYSTATHFQFLAPKAVIIQGLGTDWPAGLMTGDQEMDERIDALGYARLSTFGRYVRHIGNVITPEFRNSLIELGLAQGLQAWTPPSRIFLGLARPLRALVRLARRLRNWVYFIRTYRPPGSP
ncbi:MAG: glycosyltransferase family 2 protein [Acidobacteria bacterium]|nr:glycosyltransferase family 2 protein [Acidobacteriota bacterium]